MIADSYHHGHLRDALVVHAVQTVREHGAAGLSLRELARQIGVSHSAPRRHFQSRESLLEAVAQIGWQRLTAELRGAARAEESRVNGLEACARAYVRFAQREPHLLDVMYAHHLRFQENVIETAASDLGDVMTPGAGTNKASGEETMSGLSLLATFHGLAVFVVSGHISEPAVDALIRPLVRLLMDVGDDVGLRRQ